MKNNQQKYAVVTAKDWNIGNFKKYCRATNFLLITDKKDLTLKKLRQLNPRYVFFPHWSWIIPKDIWSNFNCVVFHMTDLPYGRGGTPLQNLILRGHKQTKISALKVDKGLDTGDIYFKENLVLTDNAQEIYKRASEIIFKKMIPKIIKTNPLPKKQHGKVVNFARRNPEQSRLPDQASLSQLYDFIRMLDADGYPKAWLDTAKTRMVFSQAKLFKNKLTANVDIYDK